MDYYVIFMNDNNFMEARMLTSKTRAKAYAKEVCGDFVDFDAQPLNELFEDKTGSDLVELYNDIAKAHSEEEVKPVKRFATRDAGIRRVRTIIEDFAPTLTKDELSALASPPAASEKAAASPPSAAATPSKPKPKTKKVKRAVLQDDGTYHFTSPAGKPRSTVVSPQRQQLIDHMRKGKATWASLQKIINKDDFATVTTLTTLCITLGYGMVTNDKGKIDLVEPLS